MNTPQPNSSGSLHPACSAFFAVADKDNEEGGWFGPSPTKEGAVKEMLSNWGGDPLTQCLVAVGYKITRETHPDLYDDDDCLSEWEWQVERPYEVYSLNDQG